MAKLSFLGEVVCVALFTSAILWQETSSSSLGPFSSTVTEETTTTNGGDSDECDDITCPLRKYCALNAENRPECVCDEACPFIYRPVCGSDGQTYVNDCLLEVEACKTNTNITKEHEGWCNDSCTGFECPYYGRCVVDSDDRPTCVCRLGCPKIYSPVCGSDNKTYSNKCVLEAQACETNTSISVLHEGECAGEDHPTKKPKCPGHKKEC